MIVKDLIEALSRVDPDLPVVSWNYETGFGFEAEPVVDRLYRFAYIHGGHVYSDSGRRSYDTTGEPIEVVVVRMT